MKATYDRFDWQAAARIVMPWLTETQAIELYDKVRAAGDDVEASTAAMLDAMKAATP